MLFILHTLTPTVIGMNTLSMDELLHPNENVDVST